jgi:hypothetical protein
MQRSSRLLADAEFLLFHAKKQKGQRPEEIPLRLAPFYF